LRITREREREAPGLKGLDGPLVGWVLGPYRLSAKYCCSALAGGGVRLERALPRQAVSSHV